MIYDPSWEYNKDRTLYHQCILHKELPKGTKTTTIFIPEKFAVMEKVIKLKDNNGEWEDGWVVKFISKAKYNSDYFRMASREHLKHRKELIFNFFYSIPLFIFII